MIDISVIVGGSIVYPDHYAFTSGLSMIFLFAESERIGIALNPTKLVCAECNTPVAEIAAGSIIIRSKHHGKRHSTALSLNDIKTILQ